MAVTVPPDLMTRFAARFFGRGRATIRNSFVRIGERGSSLSALLAAGATAAGVALAVAQQLAPGPASLAATDPDKLVYSPWTKFCSSPLQGSGTLPVCFTGREAMTDAGESVAAVALIEPIGSPKKLFRVTVPAPLQLRYGTRLIIDHGAPLTALYFTCSGNSCISDYDGTADLVAKLKAGQNLEVQAIALDERPISLGFSLGDFAKAADGAPTDPHAPAGDQQNVAGGMKKK
jgi:invasion protein IalB